MEGADESTQLWWHDLLTEDTNKEYSLYKISLLT